MREEEKVVKNRFGEKMDVLVQKPRGEGPFPAVIFVSGIGMTMHEWKNSFDEIAGRLVESGIMTVQFTFPIFDEKGKCREIPLRRRGQIVEDVLSWLMDQKDIGKGRIGTIAQSYGVETVLAMNKNRVKSLVFVSGAYFPQRSFAQRYEKRGVAINYHGDTALLRSNGQTIIVGREFWSDMSVFDDFEKVKKIHQPAFIIHGDKDINHPPSDAKKVFEAISNKDKKIKIFAGGDHGIIDVPRPMREEFLGDIMQWFTQALKGED